jgi:hypothetical protein
MSEERILQLIKESLKSAKSVEYKNTAQADDLLRQAIELARKERFTKESFLEACAESSNVPISRGIPTKRKTIS